MLAAAKAWSTTNCRDDLKKITVPVLAIHGTSDDTVPTDKSARKTVKLLPSGTLFEYEGEPHGLFMTAADRLNDSLLQFIAGESALPINR
jgi:non-heme chloroperoxidase